MMKLRMLFGTTLFPAATVFTVGMMSALPSVAATYYVAKAGSDSNACTQDQPCLTITRARNIATKPGDIVQVGPGTYPERITLSTSGSSSGKITFRGHDGTGCPTTVDTDVNSRGLRTAPTVSMQGWQINASYIAIDCFRISGTSDDALSVSTGQGNIDIINNYVDASATPGSPSAGVSMDSGVPASGYAANLYVARNYITATQTGLWVHCRACTFEDNELDRMMGGTGSVDHDYVQLFGIDLVFRHNYFHGNRKPDCPGDCHNDCFQSWNIGQIGEVAQNITIDRNVCFNSQQKIIVRDVVGPGGTQPSGSHSNWVITNNVFAHGLIDDSAGSSWCMDLEGVRDVATYNNLCVDAAMTGYRYGTNAVHRNNIHWNSGSYDSYFADNGGSVTADHNLIGGFSVLTQSFPNDILNKNPLFVDSNADNYRLQAGSPAIGAGVAVGLTVDLTGLLRPQNGAVTIGPYESSAGGTLQPPLPPTNVQISEIR